MNFWHQPFKPSLIIRFVLSIAILTAIGTSVYVSSFHAPFIYDDEQAIVDNPYIKDLSQFQTIVGIQRVFSRSFLLLTYALNVHLGGNQSFSFHLLNSIIHICTGVLLFFLCWEFLKKETPELRIRLKNLPLIASLIHVLNPLNVESVVYLSSRSSILATFFYLAATLVFVRWKKNLKNNFLITNLLYWSLLIAILFLGFGSKAIIVTMPLMTIFLLMIFNESIHWKRLFYSTTPLLVCLLIYLGVKQYMTGNIFALKTDPSSYDISRLHYFFTQFEVVTYYYALKLFLPINLNLESDFRLISSFFNFKLLFAIGTIFSICAITIKTRSKIAKFGLIWIFITLTPTSTFIPLKQIATEHRLYLPGIGFSLVFGTLWLNAIRFLTARKLLFLTTLLLMSILSINRSLDFKDEIFIWDDAVKKSPNKVLVHNNFATVLLNREMDELAEKHLKFALKLNPAFRSAYINLGHIFFKREDYQQAKKYFDLALFYGEDNGVIYYNSGLARIRLNTPIESIYYFEKAVKIKPYNPDFHYALGNAYKVLKRNDEAIKEYKKTLNLDPKNSSAQNNMGVIFFENKMYKLAEEAFLKTLLIDKNHAETYNNLATLYLKIGKYKSAVQYLKQYIVLKPFDRRKTEVLETLQKITNKNS